MFETLPHELLDVITDCLRVDDVGSFLAVCQYVAEYGRRGSVLLKAAHRTIRDELGIVTLPDTVAACARVYADYSWFGAGRRYIVTVMRRPYGAGTYRTVDHVIITMEKGIVKK
jgi:hypothetical protein